MNDGRQGAGIAWMHEEKPRIIFETISDFPRLPVTKVPRFLFAWRSSRHPHERKAWNSRQFHAMVTSVPWLPCPCCYRSGDWLKRNQKEGGGVSGQSGQSSRREGDLRFPNCHYYLPRYRSTSSNACIRPIRNRAVRLAATASTEKSHALDAPGQRCRSSCRDILQEPQADLCPPREHLSDQSLSSRPLQIWPDSG